MVIVNTNMMLKNGISYFTHDDNGTVQTLVYKQVFLSYKAVLRLMRRTRWLKSRKVIFSY